MKAPKELRWWRRSRREGGGHTSTWVRASDEDILAQPCVVEALAKARADALGEAAVEAIEHDLLSVGNPDLLLKSNATLLTEDAVAMRAMAGEIRALRAANADLTETLTIRGAQLDTSEAALRGRVAEYEAAAKRDVEEWTRIRDRMEAANAELVATLAELRRVGTYAAPRNDGGSAMERPHVLKECDTCGRTKRVFADSDAARPGVPFECSRCNDGN